MVRDDSFEPARCGHNESDSSAIAMNINRKEPVKRMSNLISFLPVVFVVIVIVYEKFRQKSIRSEKEYD